MRIILLTALFFITILNCAEAQFTNNYWIVGQHTGIDFNSGHPVVNLAEPCWSFMALSSTSICDRNGMLIFSSDALEVYDRNGNPMPHGDTINRGTISDTYYGGGYYPVEKGAIIVPFPNDTNRFYLFYVNLEWNIDNGVYTPEKLYYAIIDRRLNGGLGDVVQKDVAIISNDTLSDAGDLMAIKHGNGNDWWIITRKYKRSVYYAILVDNNGVHAPIKQTIGNDYNTYAAYSGICNQALDGSKLAYLYQSFELNPTHDGQLDLFDFDRCTGFLSNSRSFVLSNPSDTNFRVDKYLQSVCFSANGRYLYATESDRIDQLDLQRNDMVDSMKVIWLRLNTMVPFFHIEIAPDNKIYIGPYGGDTCMHIINYPDSFGIACHFKENAINVHGAGNYANGGPPNVPNFKLGAINCSIGINAINAFNQTLNLFPNPCRNELSIKNDELRIEKVEIENVLGQIVICPLLSANSTDYCQLNTDNLPSGIYFLKATDEKGLIHTVKFVKQ